MADAVTNFAALGTIDAVNAHIARQTYRLAERRLQLGKFATRYQLPQRMGKTLRIVRHKRLALPVATLTEGTPPDAVALSIDNVDVTVEQWGIVCLLTDVVQLTLAHPALPVAIERTGMAMAELLERETATTLQGGTQVFYGGDATARSNIDAGDKVSTTTLLKVLATLRDLGASEFESGLFGGVMPPQIEMDIQKDSTFLSAMSYANSRKLEYGEIGVWAGVRWVRGNFMPAYKAVAAPTTGAATAEKAQYTLVNGGGSLAQGNYQVKVVARDKNSDYERKISLASGNIAADAGNDDRITVVMPSSTNYVYDVYMTQVGGAVFYKMSSRLAASASVTYSTQPAGTEAVAPVGPGTDQLYVFTCWVFGKDAFGRVELDGMSLQSYVTGAGAEFSNPLAQGRKIGSKIMWKCFIIDNNFFARIEAASEFAGNFPA